MSMPGGLPLAQAPNRAAPATFRPAGINANELTPLLEAFRSAWLRDGTAEPADFLPPPNHQLRRLVLGALVRIDLEQRWSHGQPRRLEEYRTVLPELFSDPETIRLAALEEWRWRVQCGE